MAKLRSLKHYVCLSTHNSAPHPTYPFQTFSTLTSLYPSSNYCNIQLLNNIRVHLIPLQLSPPLPFSIHSSLLSFPLCATSHLSLNFWPLKFYSFSIHLFYTAMNFVQYFWQWTKPFSTLYRQWGISEFKYFSVNVHL